MPSIVVKLGSAVVADESGRLRKDALANVCRDIGELRRRGVDVVVVTSGAIARGMGEIDLPARPRVMEELQAASAIGQGKLYPVYDSLLEAEGIASAQILLTFFDMSARSHYVNARRTLQKLLDWGVVPVINENDTTTTDEISFGDNDLLAAQVAVLLGVDLLLLLTSTDGLFTADPQVDPSAELVREVKNMAELDGMKIGQTMSTLGSGGMRSKVVGADMATAAGITTVIANGSVAGVVRDAWEGKVVGSKFHPQANRFSSFKLWLKFAKPSRGTLTVDAGAARALTEKGTSLLPVGVVQVEGDFEAGDAVEVLARDGSAIGKGIVNYPTAELTQIMGLQSLQIQSVLPNASAEAIHRDFFVAD